MKRSTTLLLAIGIGTGTAPAVAQTAPPNPQIAKPIVPPGQGMIDQPCPDMKAVVPNELAEPGKPAKLAPELIATYLANQTYTKQYDWPWLCRYRTANAATLAAGKPEVVFMGDSITELWGLYDPGFFKNGLIDRGISGQTTPQMLLRFYQDVVALHPRVVHIMGGTNDIAGNTGPTDANAFKDNIRAMVELAQANGIQVVLASIPPASAFTWAPALKPAGQVVALNTWLKGYAAERNAIYADYYSALVDPATSGMRKDTTSDGVHPATLGYATMRPIAERAIASAERLPQRKLKSVQ
jgi:lysophospholipase L1-like esterase